MATSTHYPEEPAFKGLFDEANQKKGSLMRQAIAHLYKPTSAWLAGKELASKEQSEALVEFLLHPGTPHTVDDPLMSYTFEKQRGLVKQFFLPVLLELTELAKSIKNA